MIGFTVQQPWAALIAHGYKAYETRSRKAAAVAVGSRVFVHAGKYRPVDGYMAGHDWKVFRSAAIPYDGAPGDVVQHHASGLPGMGEGTLHLAYGVVVCTAMLGVPMPIVSARQAWKEPRARIVAYDHAVRVVRVPGEDDMPVPAEEVALGDWSVGRWVWPLYGVQQTRPVPATGSLAWFQIPDEQLVVANA